MGTITERRFQRQNSFQALLAIVLLFGFVTSVRAADSSKVDSFAKCLADKKTTMYGSFLCPHCDDQKKLFGSAFQYVRYVECSILGSRQMALTCQAAQIRFTPTWVFSDGERRTGLQSLEQLSAKTGCRLP